MDRLDRAGPVGALTASTEDRVARALDALECVPNADLPRAEWVRVAYALFAATGGAREARAAFLAWSAKSKKHTRAGTPAKLWDSIVKAPPRRITGATLYGLAYANGWQGRTPDCPRRQPGTWTRSRGTSARGLTRARQATTATRRGTLERITSQRNGSAPRLTKPPFDATRLREGHERF